MTEPVAAGKADRPLSRGRDRAFDDFIVGLVSRGERVIDLGCGRGDLLHRLKAEKDVRDQGIESSGAAAAGCIARGLSVVEGRMEDELPFYGDSSFDLALLNQVLTLVRDPLDLVEEALRVAGRAIVTFPNFTHWRVRLQILHAGNLPVTPSLPYQWHDSPHLRYVSVADFRAACRERRWQVVRERFVYGDGGGTYRPVKRLPGLRASLALFELARRR